MLAEAILRGEVDNELAEIVKAAISRTSKVDINLNSDRYEQASIDFEAELLRILAQKRKMEAEGHPAANAVLVAAAAVQVFQENLGRYLAGMDS